MESKLSEVQTSIPQISALVHQNKADIDQLKSSPLRTDTKLTAQEKSIASLELAVSNCKDDVATIQQELVNDDVMAILRNKNKFYKDIAVPSDKTKAQREYLRSLWSQVDE